MPALSFSQMLNQLCDYLSCKFKAAATMSSLCPSHRTVSCSCRLFSNMQGLKCLEMFAKNLRNDKDMKSLLLLVVTTAIVSQTVIHSNCWHRIHLIITVLVTIHVTEITLEWTGLCNDFNFIAFPKLYKAKASI